MKLHLEDFEEKFYFKTSHLFWHLVTGLSGLALMIGVLIFFWGLTPSCKPGVKKDAYPEPVAVSPSEVLQRIAPPTPRKSVASSSPAVTKVAGIADTAGAAIAAVDSTELAYLASIDSLKALLPPKNFPWKSRGHWERDWNRKKWVVDVWGISDRLKSAYERVSADNFIDKKSLLDAYIALISQLPGEKDRYKVFKSATAYTKDDLPKALSHMQALAAAAPQYHAKAADALVRLATFGRKNPRDGLAFIEYMNATIPQFADSIHHPMLKQFVKCYYEYFDDIGRQKEATAMFLPLASNFPADKQAKALREFYKLYLEKNADREREIAGIDRRYQSALKSAGYVVSRKRADKAGYRDLGLKLFGGSVVFIAFVALFLVLLSIQRNIRQLREATADQLKS